MTRAWPRTVALPVLPVFTLLAAGAVMTARQTPPPSAPRPGETARRPAADPRTDAAATAVIRGRVSAADGRALRQAEIRAIESTGGISHAATTDDDGRYELGELPADGYTITATKPGYAGVELGSPRPPSPGKRLRLAAAEVAERIDFVLPRAATISGRVLDESGDAIEGATVALQQVRFIDGRRQLVATGRTRRTNDLGGFRLFAVQPGRYLLSATVAAAGPYRLPGYAPTYFPAASNVADGEALSVGSADELSNVDIRVMPGRTVKVSGAALSSRGQPYHGRVLLGISQRSGGLATAPVSGTVFPDGTFEFVNVVPGDYVMQAIELGYLGGEFATRFVAVGDGDVGGLTLRAISGSTVSGRITFEGDASRVKPQDFQFMFMQADFDLAPMQGTFRAKISDDWTFEMVGLVGPLFIRPIGRPEWLLKSIRANGVDITDTAVSFGRRDDSLSDVDVVLTTRGAAITGAAANGRGEAVNDYAVVVFAADRSRWYPHSRFMKTAESRADGTFSVRGLPAADYFVAAVGRLPGAEGASEWQNPTWLEAVSGTATRVTLGEGQRGVVSLQLTR